MNIRCRLLRLSSLVLVVASLGMAGIDEVQAEPQVMEVAVSHYGGGGKDECGKGRACHGSPTACGQIFNMYGLSVAHKTLACGTVVQFCYEERCVVTKVTDRGPYATGRSFDLSYGAAKQLGIASAGVVRVAAKILN